MTSTRFTHDAAIHRPRGASGLEADVLHRRSGLPPSREETTFVLNPRPAPMTVLSSSSSHGAVVVTVIGEVDMSVTDCLRSSLFEALATAPRTMIIDLSMVSFASAAMLRVLLDVMTAARTRGVGCAIVSDQHAVRRVIHLSGLDPVLRPWPSVESAECDLTSE